MCIRNHESCPVASLTHNVNHRRAAASRRGAPAPDVSAEKERLSVIARRSTRLRYKAIDAARLLFA